MAKFSPARKIIEYTGGTFNLTLTLNSDETPASGWSIEKFEPSDDTYKVTITSTSTTVCNMIITVFPNNETVELHKTFYVLQNASSAVNPKKFRYAFTVEYDISNVYQPIWKDIYYTKYNKAQRICT